MKPAILPNTLWACYTENPAQTLETVEVVTCINLRPYGSYIFYRSKVFFTTPHCLHESLFRTIYAPIEDFSPCQKALSPPGNSSSTTFWQRLQHWFTALPSQWRDMIERNKRSW